MTRSCRSRAIRSRSVEDGQPLRVLPVLGEFERDARLRREGLDHLHRLMGQRHRPGVAAHREHAADVPGRAQREDDGRPQRHVLPGRAGHPLVVAEILQGDGLAGGQHLAGHRGADREDQADGLRRACPGRMLDDELLAVLGRQRQRDQIGA